jgi:hypothetical protein
LLSASRMFELEFVIVYRCYIQRVDDIFPWFVCRSIMMIMYHSNRFIWIMLHIWTASLTYGLWASTGLMEIMIMVVPDSAGDASAHACVQGIL